MQSTEEALGTFATLAIGVGAITAGSALTMTVPRRTRGQSSISWLGAGLIGIGFSIFAAGIIGGGA